MERDDSPLTLIDELGITDFEQCFPWIGGDLQTLRDTFVDDDLPNESGKEIQIPVPEIPCGFAPAGKLLAFLDRPDQTRPLRGLVLMLHGLGGSSRRMGLRRMSIALLHSGFAVLRVNLRGADPGRELAAGTYSAKCNSDLIPVITSAKQICHSFEESYEGIKHPLPLYGVGISLGGTILINACLDQSRISQGGHPILDGLVCISSPLDLAACSASIERPRNYIYQYWLLHRLVRQTLADPFGIRELERDVLISSKHRRSRQINSIRAFDAAITAPRWGYESVDAYYEQASPYKTLINNMNIMPKTLLIQSIDDPWVPYLTLNNLREKLLPLGDKNKVKFLLTRHGGHNGFHSQKGCWGDQLVAKWLLSISS